jgi:predicted nucleic acid-binding protein
MVVFDSSLVIDALKKKKAARDLIASNAEKERIAITIISKYEILRGTDQKDFNLVTEWLDQFVVYDMDDNALEEIVKAYKKLADKGKLINELDILIAGIASANNEILITTDKDFLNLESLRITVL